MNKLDWNCGSEKVAVGAVQVQAQAIIVILEL